MTVNHTVQMDECIPLLTVNKGPTSPYHYRCRTGNIRQTYAVASSCFAAISVGFGMGYSSPALPALLASGMLTEEQGSWFGSLMMLGGMIGGLFGGILADKFGRKATMIFIALPLTLGWLMNTLNTGVGLLLFGRLVMGIACGVCTICVPAYIAEVSVPALRGGFGTCFQASIMLGVLMIYIAGLVLPCHWMSVVAAVPPATMAVAMYIMPESPRWLVRNGHTESASRALCWLRGTSDPYDVSSELNDLTEGLTNDMCASKLTPQDLTDPSIYKPLLLCIFMMCCQSSTGANAVVFYTNAIFSTAGYSTHSGIPTVIFGIIQFGAVIVAAFVVDRMGRRPLFLISGISMTISCVALGLYYYFYSPSLSWLSITSLCIYIAAYSIGWGPLPWLLISELLPAKGYGISSGLATATNWGTAFIITKLFAAMQHTLLGYGTFWTFATISLLSTIGMMVFLPETKGKNLRDIADEFLWWEVYIWIHMLHAYISELCNKYCILSWSSFIIIF